MPKVNLLWHNFFIFVFPFFYIKHMQWCLISKQDGVDPLFLGLSSKYTWNHSAGNAKIIESWIEKGGWIGASGFEEWQHGELPGLSFHFTRIPTVGTKRTCSLKPPKGTDIKTSKNNKKACFLWPMDKEKRSQTKYWWGTLNCSTTGAPAGSPTHQWKPWAVPVPTAKLGPSAVSSACNSWSSKAADLHHPRSLAVVWGGHLICLQQHQRSPRTSQTPFHSKAPKQRLPAFQAVAQPGPGACPPPPEGHTVRTGTLGTYLLPLQVAPEKTEQESC